MFTQIYLQRSGGLSRVGLKQDEEDENCLQKHSSGLDFQAELCAWPEDQNQTGTQDFQAAGLTEWLKHVEVWVCSEQVV